MLPHRLLSPAVDTSVLGVPLATDNCSEAFIKVLYNEVRTDGSCASDYILVRTWEASDICGNIAEHTQTITVTDSTAPITTTEFETEIKRPVTCLS